MWLEINSHIDNCYGYYHGFGADAGYYAYDRHREGYEDWIIADTFEPTLNSDYGLFKVQPYTYNESPVFRNENKSHYIFKSTTGSWILFERLQEPISYYALDLSTHLGDGWYRLQNAPSFNKENYSYTITANPQGTYWEQNDISVQWNYHCLEFDWNASSTGWLYYPYGKYTDGDSVTKVLGTPVWITKSPEGSMTRKEVVATGGQGQEKTYIVGPKTMHYDEELTAWVIGTEGEGRWYIGADHPMLNSTAHYDCFEMVSGVKKPVLSSYVDISFLRADRGDEQTSTYFGEVSQWY